MRRRQGRTPRIARALHSGAGAAALAAWHAPSLAQGEGQREAPTALEAAEAPSDGRAFAQNWCAAPPSASCPRIASSPSRRRVLPAVTRVIDLFQCSSSCSRADSSVADALAGCRTRAQVASMRCLSFDAPELLLRAGNTRIHCRRTAARWLPAWRRRSSEQARRRAPDARRTFSGQRDSDASRASERRMRRCTHHAR